ncbi:TMEM165/GDT1 family protein [Ferrovibrio terrae]|uniref:TMEM165/GDT1 family protein n=1 Tax=Ferrovibrio terrae TaxID=2594003 RepID=UPI003137BA3D
MFSDIAPDFAGPFLTTTGVVAIAEIGDKTQLLSLLLAARFKKPWPIMAGILAATIANHLAAAALGVWIEGLLEPRVLRWVLIASFVAMAVWTLIPDKLDDDAAPKAGRWGAFLTTLVLFFLAEIGDKTQLATTALAARFDAVLVITLGSTLGLMLANVPVVFFGEALLRRLPLVQVRYIAAGAFVLLALAVLLAG